MEIIKVEKVSIKKQTDAYTIREITTPEGKKLDTFDDLKEGQEYTGNITPNANAKFNPSFKIEKDKKKFSPKDYSAEKKMCALTNAVNSVKQIEGKITTENVLALAAKYFEFLK